MVETADACMMELRMNDIRSAFISSSCRSKKFLELMVSALGGDRFSIVVCALFIQGFCLIDLALF